MKNKANEKLFYHQYGSNLEALALSEQALKFEIDSYTEATEAEKKDLERLSQINAEYELAIQKTEKELIKSWQGKSEVHDKVIKCLETADFSELVLSLVFP